MAKHTAGPWEVESVNSDALHDVCLGYVIPNAGHPILIASTYDDEPEDEGRPGHISAAEAEANARLIASAPDLLAACKTALECYEEFHRCHMLSDSAVADMETIRAAIAKAEGVT